MSLPPERSTGFGSSSSARSGPGHGPPVGSAPSGPKLSRLNGQRTSVAAYQAPPRLRDVEMNLNTSGNFTDTNVNKRSLSLNVRTRRVWKSSDA